MRQKIRDVAFLTCLLTLMSVPQARAAETAPATLQVMLLDDAGSLVHSAHIYIFSQDKKKFFGTREGHGTTLFDLPSGSYRVYAAFTEKNNGVIEHYSSPEARVTLSAAEPTSVILLIQKAEDPEMTLSDTAREKMGLDENLTNNIN